MNETRKIRAALDFSTDELALAVMNDGRAMTARVPMPPRDSSRMASWITERLSDWDLSIADVESWACGTGPGSFTALRSSAALVAGFAATKGPDAAKGVPSALAIAAEVSANRSEPAEIAVLYDGRRGEILAIPVRPGHAALDIPDDSEIFAVSRNDFSALRRFDVLAAAGREAAAVKSILPREIIDNVAFVDDFPVERLLDFESAKWNRDSLLNPIYLRPATHVAPVTPRVV